MTVYDPRVDAGREPARPAYPAGDRKGPAGLGIGIAPWERGVGRGGRSHGGLGGGPQTSAR